MSAKETLRLLVADLDPQRPVLTDEQVASFLSLQGITTPNEDHPGWLVRRAAADALEAIAASEVLVGKVIRTQDTQTDGAKVSAELRALAASYRERADLDEEAASADEWAGLAVVEFEPWR